MAAINETVYWDGRLDWLNSYIEKDIFHFIHIQ